jgi:DNA-binding NarL/FixJ family response regulator
VTKRSGRIDLGDVCRGSAVARKRDPTMMSDATSQMQLLRQRIHALSGRITVEATPGWGTEMAIAIPLDPPRAVDPAETAWDLRPRELEVVELLVVGRRNKAIAEELSISENTVKFHISRVLRKLGASSRAEAVGMILAARPGFLS